MCFGGSKQAAAPKAKTVAYPAPAPSAISVESSSEETAASLAEKKRKQLVALKYGISSTVKTGSDLGPLNLLMPALMGSSQKTKLGV